MFKYNKSGIYPFDVDFRKNLDVHHMNYLTEYTQLFLTDLILCLQKFDHQCYYLIFLFLKKNSGINSSITIIL